MEGEESEQLFLLEFLVDSVNIKRPTFGENPILSQLSTIFQFLKFPPLEIREKEQQNKGDEPPSFKIGKSCLFAIPSKKLVEVSKVFNIKVSVARRFPPGVLPEKTIVGDTTVDISSDFAYVVTEVLTNPQAIPKSKSIKNNFVLRSIGECTPVGSVFLFLRISCFGKLIVNEFHLNTELPHGSQAKKEEDVRKGELEFSRKVAGLKDGQPIECRRLDVKRSSSGSSQPLGESNSGAIGEDDFTEVGAKVQGRWFTIRVPKDKLRSHHVDVKAETGGGIEGLGMGAGMSLGVAADIDGAPTRSSASHYDSTTRNLMLKLLQQPQLQAGSGARVPEASAASLPPSREGQRRAGSVGAGRARPTSTPLDMAPPLLCGVGPEGKAAKVGKMPKNSKNKGKASEGRGKEKKSKKSSRIRAL